MKIYLATDHAGFELKNIVKEYLKSNSTYEVEDCGALSYDPLDDYPDYISVAAEKVSQNPVETKAIIFGGSGQGEAMLANKYKNVRAALYYGGSVDIVTLSREHNNSNILSLGARFVDEVTACNVIELWLRTTINSDEKYLRRIDKAERYASSQ